MSQSSFVTKNLGSANLTQINFPSKTSVTQLTSLATAVTNNAPCGFINTVSTTLATQGSSSFTCSNSMVNTSKMVLANIQGYTGTNGSPSVYVRNIGNGMFTLTVQNRDLTDPLNGVVKIGYIVI